MSKLCQFCKSKEATEDEPPGLLPQISLMRVAHRLPGMDCLANVWEFITQKDSKHWKLLGISVPIAEVKDAWCKPRLEKTTIRGVGFVNTVDIFSVREPHPRECLHGEASTMLRSTCHPEQSQTHWQTESKTQPISRWQFLPSLALVC